MDEKKKLIDAIKEAAYKLGLIADYPVEVGTDGIWTYRKWASGIAECWTQGYTLGSPKVEAWYTWSSLLWQPNIILPFEFDGSPFVLANNDSSAASGGVIESVIASPTAITEVYGRRPGSSGGYNIYTNFFVVGAWKKVGGYYLTSFLNLFRQGGGLFV